MQSFTGALAEAYLATSYVVRTGTDELVVKPNQRSSDIDRLLCSLKARTAVFITACNPYSLTLSPTTNSDRHRRLKLLMRRRRLRFLEGEGRGEIGDWPPEESLFVVGVSREMANALGREWHQNAIVFVELGRTAELVMLRRVE